MALDPNRLNELARRFVRNDLVALYDIDGALVSEWLGAEYPEFAGLADDDESDEALDDFMDGVDEVLRELVQKVEVDA